MEQVVMPKLITPEITEIIAKNPEVFKTIIDNQPGESVITGKDCTIDCGCNPTNIKLILCNVTIGLDDNQDEARKQIDDLHIKIAGDNIKQAGKSREALLNEQNQLKLEIAVLEARAEETEKILRMIPRQIMNRKLVGRCKKEIKAAEGQLASKKRNLSIRTSLWSPENTKKNV